MGENYYNLPPSIVFTTRMITYICHISIAEIFHMRCNQYQSYLVSTSELRFHVFGMLDGTRERKKGKAGKHTVVFPHVRMQIRQVD